MAQAESADVAGSWAQATSLVGREHETAELAGLLRGHRLVTVTGPGGVGKTRLAVEVARTTTDGFPDGTFFVGLERVADPALVAAEVAAALGVRETPGQPVPEVLAEVLAPRQLLLVLDNCEHVLDAVAKLCGSLLSAADDVRILVTSREQLWVGGEARYRLSPLALPRSDDPEEIGRSGAVALFTERARHAAPGFVLSREDAALAARVARRLDGMPLAIELAAARVEGLGLAGLADRIDDALGLLNSKDAADRHRSLAAVADWSYQLLSGPEQSVFRRLGAFPGPFTLEAAKAVAGPDAEPVVLRLVDCSLVAPPRLGPDGRDRYTMLQTLRAYALYQLAAVGEEQETAAALAGFAWSVAREAAAGCETGDRELAALRWLDAEDATLRRAFSWMLAHAPDDALRLATALTRWLRIRGRMVEAQERLRAAIARSSPASEGWIMAQVWLAYLASSSADPADSLAYLAAAIEADSKPSRALVEALICQVVIRLNLGGSPAEAAHDAREALAAARKLGDPATELQALAVLSLTAYYAGDATEMLRWARHAQVLLPSDAAGERSDIPGDMARWSYYIVATVLAEIPDFDSARRVCAAGLALSRRADDLLHLVSLLGIMTKLERLAGNLADAGAHLREAVGIASRTGDHINLTNLIDECGYLCAATGRWADAVTLWAAHGADLNRRGLPGEPGADQSRAEYLRQIGQALNPDQVREAEERGARMPIPAAAELVIMISTAPREESPAPAKLLSPREGELVTLVAQGHTNSEIAAQLHISPRTVTSHLDRIRDKTGYRRRADLTRLALAEKLI